MSRSRERRSPSPDHIVSGVFIRDDLKIENISRIPEQIATFGAFAETLKKKEPMPDYWMFLTLVFHYPNAAPFDELIQARQQENFLHKNAKWHLELSISRLRRKIRVHGYSFTIGTVRGLGYKLVFL